jgi:hypothetical protein
MNENVGRLSRREIIIGGGLLVGAVVLGGCQGSRGAAASLPGPRWPSDADGPIVAAPKPLPGPAPADVGIPQGVMPRSAWTRAGVANPRDINPMGAINRITVHHDGMPPTDLRSVSDVKSRLEQIRRAHISRAGQPFADIGYHYIIDPAGRVWEGRSVRYQGAHVKDNNPNNLGVMVLGHFNQQRPTPQALAALDKFVAQQMARYRVPVSRVFTHQEINPTECPGVNLQRYMVQTRSRGGSMALAAARVGAST